MGKIYDNKTIHSLHGDSLWFNFLCDQRFYFWAKGLSIESQRSSQKRKGAKRLAMVLVYKIS